MLRTKRTSVDQGRIPDDFVAVAFQPAGLRHRRKSAAWYLENERDNPVHPTKERGKTHFWICVMEYALLLGCSRKI